MAQEASASPTAIVVEDDADHRSLVTTLLEESEFCIVECESGEAALATMRIRGSDVALMFADQSLAGCMDGVDLACEVKRQWPQLTMVLSSESADRLQNLPHDIVVVRKPWLALDVLIIAERARSAALGHPRP
jgi:CheY-like chemotaxis protein